MLLVWIFEVASELNCAAFLSALTTASMETAKWCFPLSVALILHDRLQSLASGALWRAGMELLHAKSVRQYIRSLKDCRGSYLQLNSCVFEYIAFVHWGVFIAG